LIEKGLLRHVLPEWTKIPMGEKKPYLPVVAQFSCSRLKASMAQCLAEQVQEQPPDLSTVFGDKSCLFIGS
jgi:hypothetical protein